MSAFELTGTGATGATGAAGTAAPTDSWVDDSANTWTFATAQTFTVSGDRTAVFTKGTRLKWTQTSVKYGVVIGSSHAAGTTTVTIATNTDYTIANAAISLNYYSYASDPPGYPGYFTYTVTLQAVSSNPTLGSGSVAKARFCVNGRQVTAQGEFVFGSSGVNAGSGNYKCPLPIPLDTSRTDLIGWGQGVDSSASNLASVLGGYVFDANFGCWRAHAATVLVSNTSPWTWAASDRLDWSWIYEMA